MIRSDDPKVFHEAWLDTPLGGPSKERLAEAERRDDPSLLLDCPGVCLKSRERDPQSGYFPKHHGILVRYDEKTDYVLVRGHNSPVSPACTWTGTVSEYRTMWQVD
jgi:hypothetical protein